MEKEQAENCCSKSSIAETIDFSSVKFTLNNGIQMPAIGIGTYRIRHEADVLKVVDAALNAGYRMFDTAAVYGNESQLKKAFQIYLPKYGLERDDIFLTTKLSPSEQGNKEMIERAYAKSLDNLGLDSADMYLIHFPGTSRYHAHDERNKELRAETWATLEELYDAGLVRAIGVSNFTTRHLNEIFTNHSLVPVVNQVEWHPYYYQPELLNLCKKNDIVLQAYCSFGGQSTSNSSLMEEPIVKKIAKKHNASCAQVLLVWALQQDVAVIPKSTNANRIKENINLTFKISEEDIKALNKLGEKNTKYAWDPNVVT